MSNQISYREKKTSFTSQIVNLKTDVVQLSAEKINSMGELAKFLMQRGVRMRSTVLFLEASLNVASCMCYPGVTSLYYGKVAERGWHRFIPGKVPLFNAFRTCYPGCCTIFNMARSSNSLLDPKCLRIVILPRGVSLSNLSSCSMPVWRLRDFPVLVLLKWDFSDHRLSLP
ncbi:hypothetical protein LWI28_016930 [Acer negundo]|uniref:Uncharacterized protein n=1 Tax=Acer negundo TaxID=4023 RepID=A0AAD5JEK5_ACENE|nr:hypothetical protein LWI28_016930 [Acer negundo]